MKLFQDPVEHAVPEHAEARSAASGHAHNPLSAEHLFGHVKDSEYIELPRFMGGEIALPQIRDSRDPIFAIRTGNAQIDSRIQPVTLRFTKFMFFELVAAAILILLFTRLASRLKAGGAPRGRLTNALESMVVFIRDEVAEPAVGHHDAAKFTPFLLTAFFFVATCNLLGLMPWAGSATGALGTTIALALVTFIVVVVAGMAKLGPVGFWLAQVPHIDLSPAMSFFIKPGIFAIEVFGLGIKHFVLAMRLFANMMAGHLVLAVILAFIAATFHSWIWAGVMPASLFGAIALSLLEVMVAFIQAYVFTFLSALFIGMAVHPH